MKRYYLSRLVGTGVEGDPIRPKIADYGVSFCMTHQPGKEWALVIVATEDHSKLLEDKDISPLPDAKPDEVLKSGPLVIKDSIGLKLSSDIKSGTKMKELVEDIGRQHNPSFKIEALNVAE